MDLDDLTSNLGLTSNLNVDVPPVSAEANVDLPSGPVSSTVHAGPVAAACTDDGSGGGGPCVKPDKSI